MSPSATTIKAYKARLDFLHKNDVDTKDPKALFNFFKQQNYEASTARNYLAAAIYENKDNPKIKLALNDALKPISTNLENLKKTQKPTARQMAKHVAWDLVQEKAMKELNTPTNNFTNEERILIALYTLLPPARLDYIQMKMYTKEPSEPVGNYFICNSKNRTVVINEYKEAVKHGQIRTEMPEKLCSLLKSYFKTYSILFPVSPTTLGNRITKVFSKLLGTPMTSTALRHSYISYKFKDAPTFKESSEIAEHMGHTVSTQQFYRFT